MGACHPVTVDVQLRVGTGLQDVQILADRVPGVDCCNTADPVRGPVAVRLVADQQLMQIDAVGIAYLLHVRSDRASC